MASQDSIELARRAEQLYEERYKSEWERTHLHKFVAIEPDSGEIFSGSTLSEAASAARKAYPDRRAFVLRVGHRTAIHIGAIRS